MKTIISLFFFFYYVIPKVLLECPLVSCPLVAFSKPKEKRACILTDGTRGYQITYLRSGVFVTCNTKLI